MRMGGQFIMRMLLDAMMYFTGCPQRVNVDGRVGEIRQMMQELMPNLCRNVMALFHAEIRTDGDIYLCQEPMSDPPDPDLGDILHASHMFRGVSNLVNDLKIDAVQKLCEQRLPGVKPDFEDDEGNQKADAGVG